jgi:nucleotide-binding universal stress UspA family protein
VTESRAAQVAGVVLVGVDGSAGSSEALRWAVDEARMRAAKLRVVHALAFDYAVEAEEASSTWGDVRGFFSPLGVMREAHRAAQDMLERVIAEIASDAEGVEIEGELVRGNPADVLVNAVGSDDLLVVGSRGRGEFTGLLLGSVSQQCAHHSPCPVAIVHARAGGTPPRGE